MSESSKYDFFMDELSSLEKMIYRFIQKSQESSEAKEELEKQVARLEKENEILKLKIEEIESKYTHSINSERIHNEGNKINLADGEAIKTKINELISRIDYHLRS
ncbi:MAG: hypothetical protein V1720_16780 [bacterium]